MCLAASLHRPISGWHRGDPSWVDAESSGALGVVDKQETDSCLWISPVARGQKMSN